MLKLDQPQAAIDEIVNFINTTFAQQGKTQAVIAVSGGIDSALSLTCTVQALGAANVTALLLPYGDQSTEFGQHLGEHLQLTTVKTINIQSLVDAAATSLQVPAEEKFRLGNLQARARMLAVYDTAKKLDALVVGTENKSEHYLGYFTRFGDAASDLEPICHLYKTQVRQLAHHLQIPAEIIDQAPSAGLWAGQTDEQEMGFTYQQADEVLEQLIDQHTPVEQITITSGDATVVNKVVNQVKAMSFKLQVPYQIKE